MTLTLSTGSFTCKKCEVTFNGTYKPQQRPRKSCPKCHNMVGMTVIIKKKIKKAHDQNSANFDTSNIIDDPNELLMSNAVRALNKQDPDVKWGNLLYNILKETKQLEAPNKEKVEVQSKLKQYSTTDLISLRKKLTGNLLEDG